MPCEFRRNSLATEGCDQRLLNMNMRHKHALRVSKKPVSKKEAAANASSSSLAKNLWNLEVAVHKISRIDFLYVAHFKTGNNSVIAKFFRIS